MTMVIKTFKIDPVLLEELDKTAAELGINRSEAIRKAIMEFVYRERLGFNRKRISVAEVIPIA